MQSRRNFVKILGGGVSGLIALELISLSGCTPENPDEQLNQLLQQLAEATDESARFQILKQATELPDIDPALRAHMLSLLQIVDHWANGRKKFTALGESTSISNAYLCGFFNRKVSPDERLLPEVDEDSPVFPFIALYRARMLVAQVMEHGDLQANESVRNAYYSEAQGLMSKVLEVYPNHDLPNMYLGKLIPWQSAFEADPKAPDWANQQRECLEKLTDIIHWWIDNRQVDDGQFGGGWGDDVEMWRKWIPVLVAFNDSRVRDSQALLSEGLFALDRMKGGYTDHITDVEHTAEDSADSCTAMMHIQPDNIIWQQRALRLIELMEKLWTGKNERGYLQFKSTYFTSEEVDLTPRKACDTVYHPRAVQPALLLWQRTANPAIGNLISEWMKTWVDVTAREERGKPKGIIPSAIHWPEGHAGGIREEWWKPGNYTDNPLYVWPSAMRMMVNTLLLTYHMTKDQTYLQPIFSMAEIFRKYGFAEQYKASAEGTAAWCAQHMHAFMPDVLAKYRTISGDTQWDDLIEKAGNGYIQFRLNGDRQLLTEELGKTAQAFAYNFLAFTEEVRWTDRVFAFNKAYLNYIREEKLPTYSPDFLFSSLTGHVGNAMYFPLNTVEWETHSREIAILVTEADSSRFEAELFHFGESPRQLSAMLFLLKDGDYKLRLIKAEDESLLSEQYLYVGGRGIRISIELPPRTLCKLQIKKPV